MLTLPPIYLASQSVRRQVLLQQIGVSFQILTVNVDETALSGESPEELVRRLALEKASAGLNSADYQENRPVLGADTVVVSNDQIIGKPDDKSHFMEVFTTLSGNIHTVVTGVCLATPQGSHVIAVSTEVKFRVITPAEMAYYWAHYSPLDKAGGYGIQDFAAVFVEGINGSYSNVVGLPLAETYQLLMSL